MLTSGGARETRKKQRKEAKSAALARSRVVKKESREKKQIESSELTLSGRLALSPSVFFSVSGASKSLRMSKKFITFLKSERTITA